jgi:hypothetical protein
MDKSIIGFIIFIATFIGGRLISERALRLLTDEQKGRLLQSFSKFRLVSLFGVVGLVIGHYALRSLVPNSYFAQSAVFVGVLVAYLLISSLISFAKLKKMALPDNYINQFLLSTLIQYVGLFVFFGFMVNKS